MSKHIYTVITCDEPCAAKLVVHLPLDEAWKVAERAGWSWAMEWGKRIVRCPGHRGSRP